MIAVISRIIYRNEAKRIILLKNKRYSKSLENIMRKVILEKLSLIRHTSGKIPRVKS